MAKQVAVENNSGGSNNPKNVVQESNQSKNLFIKVDTFNEEGREIGTRIVDMYHFGTRTWMQNHLWWALHNKALVEVHVAEPQDVEDYLAEAKEALAAKFNTEKAHVAA